MKHTRRLLAITLYSILLLCFALPSHAGSLNARVNRSEIFMGETFNLIITVEGKTPSGNLDLARLEKDFLIFSRSESTKVSIINGKSTEKTEWVLTLTPRRTGNVTIPAIHLGKLVSKPLSIVIKNASSRPSNKGSQDIFLKATIDNQNPYEDSQFTYTVKLFYDKDILNASLSGPQIPDAIVTRLGKDINYQTTYKGKPYQVIERNYAIFPQKAGKLNIPPSIFTGNIDTRSVASPYQQYYDLSGKMVRRITPSMDIKVLAKPAEIKNQLWLPAKNVSITETWSSQPPKFIAGQPITRTIRISAKGLPADRLPKFTLNTVPGFKVYPDKPVDKTTLDGKWISGSRVVRSAMIPDKSGPLTLSKIKVPWWNITTNKMEVAVLPAKSITVLPSILTSNTNTGEADPTISTSTTTKPIHSLSIEENKNIQSPVLHYLTLLKTNLFKIILAAVSISFIMIALFYLRRQKKHVSDFLTADQNPNSSLSSKQALKKLKKACMENDLHTIKYALLEWAKVYWPNQDFNNIGDVLKQGFDERLESSLKQLDQSLYAKEKSDWDGHRFWKFFIEHIKSFEKKKNDSDNDPLPPLLHMK